MELMPYLYSPVTDLVLPQIMQQSDAIPDFYNVGDSTSTHTVSLHIELFITGLKVIKSSQKKEILLLEAVRNFARKINFSELNEALEDGDMSLEEYEGELEKNSDKYAITLRDLNSPDDIFYIIELMEKVGTNIREFTTSEVSEMFSVKESELIKAVNNCFIR